jgi:hypothetical protein
MRGETREGWEGSEIILFCKDENQNSL